jgi:hypothetical protein
MDRKWTIILAFLAGTIFAEIAADPTDYLFFQRAGEAGFSPSEAIGFWYFLTSGFYTALFVAAYIISRMRIIKPEHFIYAMMALVGWGAWQTYRALSANVPSDQILIMLALPVVVSFGLLLGLRRQVAEG